MRAVLLFVGVALAAGQHSQPSIAGLIPTVDVLVGDRRVSISMSARNSAAVARVSSPASRFVTAINS